MATKKVTRKELLKPGDEFLSFSDRAALFVRDHSRQFSYAGMALAAILLIYLGVNTYTKYVNRKGQDLYNAAYHDFARKGDSGSDQRDFKHSEETFRKVIDQYSLSKVSRMALPQLAYLNFLEREYDEAISLYREFLTKAPDNSPYHSLAKMALAACYEEKGDWNRAIQTLKEITEGSNDFLKDQSLLSQARVYRLAGQHEDSKKALEEFVQEFKFSPSLPLAKAYLNELP